MGYSPRQRTWAAKPPGPFVLSGALYTTGPHRVCTPGREGTGLPGDAGARGFPVRRSAAYPGRSPAGDPSVPRRNL
ncbi:hypothetical protein STTU_2998 [Streptomyces sp. Tu6071]|nr:hypothetical protein STTU_2998 [Streptomyces sp. Tu6071]